MCVGPRLADPARRHLAPGKGPVHFVGKIVGHAYAQATQGLRLRGGTQLTGCPCRAGRSWVPQAGLLRRHVLVWLRMARSSAARCELHAASGSADPGREIEDRWHSRRESTRCDASRSPRDRCREPPVGHVPFDEPRIRIVFLVICRLLRKLFRRRSPCQRLPSARCLDHLLDRISCRLGMFALPQQPRMGCSLHDAVNAVRGEPGEFSVDLGPDSPRLIVWGGRAYYDQWD